MKDSVCETIHWNTGNTKGVSFFYSHKKCFPRGVKGPSPKNHSYRSLDSAKCSPDTRCTECGGLLREEVNHETA